MALANREKNAQYSLGSEMAPREFQHSNETAAIGKTGLGSERVKEAMAFQLSEFFKINFLILFVGFQRVILLNTV